MKWGEIKKRIEEQGVNDEDEVGYIDIGMIYKDGIECTKDWSGEWHIYS